jgi:hypothetical protein
VSENPDQGSRRKRGFEKFTYQGGIFQDRVLVKIAFWWLV